MRQPSHQMRVSLTSGKIAIKLLLDSLDRSEEQDLGVWNSQPANFIELATFAEKGLHCQDKDAPVLGGPCAVVERRPVDVSPIEVPARQNTLPIQIPDIVGNGHQNHLVDRKVGVGASQCTEIIQIDTVVVRR